MPSTTLIYDSDCGFCPWLLAKLLAWNWRGVLRPVALETEEAIACLPGCRTSARWRHSIWWAPMAGSVQQDRLRSGVPLLPGGTTLASLAERAPYAARLARDLGPGLERGRTRR